MEAGKSKSLDLLRAVMCMGVIVGSEFRFGGKGKGEGVQRSREKPFGCRKRSSHSLLCREISGTEVRWEVARLLVLMQCNLQANDQCVTVHISSHLTERALAAHITPRDWKLELCVGGPNGGEELGLEEPLVSDRNMYEWIEISRRLS